MSYTPVELRHVRVPRRFLGYDRAAVEKLLEEVAASFETVWRDRANLADRVEELEARLEEGSRQERVLTDTLVSAERTADGIRDRVKREAELTIAEAHGEARSILRSVQAEHERLLGENRRITALLRAALGVIDEGAVAEGERLQPVLVDPEPPGGVDPSALELEPEPAQEPAPVSPPELVQEPELPLVEDARADAAPAISAVPTLARLEPVVPAEPVHAPEPAPEPEPEPELWPDAGHEPATQAEPTPQPLDEADPVDEAEPSDELAPLDELEPFDELGPLDELEPVEDPAPGWPVYRRAGGGSSGFDWGD